MALKSPPFGRDTSCTRYLRPGRLVSGARLLAEACYRRLTTERGTLLYDRNYGLSLSQLISSDMSADEIATLPGKIRSELLKDKRIASVSVSTTVEARGPIWSMTLDIDCLSADRESFSLSVGVSDVTVQLLGIGGAA